MKKPVFPFNKFSNVDPILGPEMRSTGEVMGIAENFGKAFAKGQLGSGDTMPKNGCAFVSVRDADKTRVLSLAKSLQDQGFTIISTRGTAHALKNADIDCQIANKVTEGGRPHIVDMIKNGEISFIVNTTEGEEAIADSCTIIRSAIQHKICYATTLAGALAVCLALSGQEAEAYEVNALQNLHKKVHAAATIAPLRKKK